MLQFTAINDSTIFEITRKNILTAIYQGIGFEIGKSVRMLQVMHRLSSHWRYRQPPTSDIVFLTIIGSGTTLGKEPVNVSNNKGNSTAALIHRTALLMLFGGTACRAAEIPHLHKVFGYDL